MFITLHDVSKMDSQDITRMITRLNLAKQGIVTKSYHHSDKYIVVWKSEADYNAFVDELFMFASHRACVQCSAILRAPEDDAYLLCLACRFRLEKTETVQVPIVSSGKLPVVDWDAFDKAE